jgi:photosystem II stability/assembly factor-like uncharacterized protein
VSDWALAFNSPTTVTDVVAHPQEPSVLYVLTPQSLFKSSDAGVTYAKIATNLAPPGGALASIAVTNSSVYMGISGDPLGHSGTVAASSDDGGSFAIVASEPFVFTRLGVSLVTSTTVWAVSFPTPTDNASVWVSSDSGQTWSAALTFSGNTQLLDVAVAPSDSGTVAACAADETGAGRISVTVDGGLVWTDGLVGPANVTACAIDAVSSSSLVAFVQGEGVFTSGDGGGSWNLSGNGFPVGSAALRFRFAPSASGTVYSATGGSGVVVSQDFGADWFAANFGLSQFSITSVAVDSVNPLLVYATDAVNVYRSTSGGR